MSDAPHINPGLKKQRERQRSLRAILAMKDVQALGALGRWWVQDPDCRGESLLCHVLKRRHLWALEHLLEVGVPVCWRTVREASGKVGHADNVPDLRVVWPLLMPAVQASSELRTTLIQGLDGRSLPLTHVGELRLAEVFDGQGWEEPLEFCTGVPPFPKHTPLQWAVKKNNPGLVEVLLGLGAAYDLAVPDSAWPDWTLKKGLEGTSASDARWGGVVIALDRRLRAVGLDEGLPAPAPRAALGPRF